MPIEIVILIGGLGGLFFYFMLTYNRLIKRRNEFRNNFSQIHIQLKRRYDLIPNLVETAKGFIAHERQTLEAVIAARNQAVSLVEKAAADPTNQKNVADFMSAERGLGGAMGKFMAVVEAYPDLKASENMKTLMEELTSTENRISFARQAYNDSVMFYNNLRESFPNNFVSGAFGFSAAELFALERAEEAHPVQVSFK